MSINENITTCAQQIKAFIPYMAVVSEEASKFYWVFKTILLNCLK
jgi:hypothetical protein